MVGEKNNRKHIGKVPIDAKTGKDARPRKISIINELKSKITKLNAENRKIKGKFGDLGNICSECRTIARERLRCTVGYPDPDDRNKRMLWDMDVESVIGKMGEEWVKRN